MLFTAVAIRDTIECFQHLPRSVGKGIRKKGVVMRGNPVRHIAMIGFGEVGGIFGRDLAAAGIGVGVFDVLFSDPASRAAMLAKAKSANVRACDSLDEAIRGAELVISAVTCSAAADVARNSAPFLRDGQTYLDINSVSPETKREIARILESTKAIFVEAAVMAPVSPQRLKVPMLLGGAEAEQVAARLRSIGMNVTPISDRIGVASAVKMCRSVIIKGIEALAVESLFAARRYGAEKEVLASLAATYPNMGWDGPLPDYLISRVAEHGRRRAAEMREAAETLRNIGLEPLTVLATAERQDWLVQEMAERHISVRAGEPFSWQQLADAIEKASFTEEKSLARGSTSSTDFSL
jgi:3-hydroxyisobutyrate dehydrogenase-like beta-hydroxyacid dehydrogenase